MAKQPLIDPRVHYLLSLLRALGLDPERVVMDSLKLGPSWPGGFELFWQEYDGSTRTHRSATVTAEIAESPCQLIEETTITDLTPRVICIERNHRHG